MPFTFCYNTFRLNSKFVILFFRNINRPNKNSYCKWLRSNSCDYAASFISVSHSTARMQEKGRVNADRRLTVLLKVYP